MKWFWSIPALVAWAIALLFWWSESRSFGGWTQGSIWDFDVLIPPLLFVALLASALAHLGLSPELETAPRPLLLVLATLFAVPGLPALFLKHKPNQSFDVFLEWRFGYVGTLAFLGLAPFVVMIIARRPSMALFLRTAACSVAVAFLLALGRIVMGYALDSGLVGQIGFASVAVALPMIAVAIVFWLTSERSPA